MRISQNVDFFLAKAAPNFSVSRPFPFLRVIFFGVNYGTLINCRYKGPFYHHFCTKTDNVVCYVRTPMMSKNNCCVHRSIVALLSDVTDRTKGIGGGGGGGTTMAMTIWLLGCQRVNLDCSLPGGGTPISNRRGCSSEILNLTPIGDHLGVAQGFCDP